MKILARTIVFLLIAFSGHAMGTSGGTALEEGEWQLVEIDGEAVPLATGAKAPMIMFDAVKSRASGYAGCNNFFGQYELSGNTLKLGPVGATRRACPDAQSAIESRFLGMLENVRAWGVDSGELTLLGESGVLLARFARPQSHGAAPDLGSISIRSTVYEAAPVQLENGIFRAPAAPGAASEIFVRLTDQTAFTTIDGQGVGAVVIASSTGGSGTFIELALLFRTGEGWRNSDTVSLGDRVKVRQVGFEEGVVVLGLLAHGASDPQCCPTQETVKRFRIDNQRLVAVSEDNGGNDGGNDDSLVGTRWQWVQSRYNNDTRAVPDQPEKYTIQFAEGGKLNAKADCNVKGGSYTIDGKALSIKLLISTMAACEPGSLEEPFVRDLEGAVNYFFHEGDLFIDLKYDSGTMRFSRAR